MNRQNLFIPFIYQFLLISCAAQPTQDQPILIEAIEAESLIQSGKHNQAAVLYQTLAKSKSSRQNEFNLLAASAYIQSNDTQSAQKLVDSINSASFSVDQANKLKLIKAQISLSNGEAEQAHTQLKLISVYNLKYQDQMTYYQSLAFAHSLTGNHLQSIQARIQLTPFFETIEKRQENHSVIFNTLILLPEQTLIQQQPPAPNILGGWMSLTRLLKTYQRNRNSIEFQSKLSEWEHLFPQHPASDGFLQSYLEQTQYSFKIPTAIALLLPESGRFAQAAEVIKKGFLAAYQHSQSGFQPSIRFYDSSKDQSVTLYHQAIQEGAELVIGPLRKDKIQNLAMGTELTIPVLALNHIPNLSRNNLFQFGLSPIDDAQQISSKADHDGNQKALILTPKTNTGQRTEKYLTEYWQQTTGTVLEAQSFNPKESDFSEPIKKLLNLDESKNRYNRLKRILARNIKFTERRRQDVDAILLSANTRTARSIYPQLRFYRATQIPVYATPNIYSGQPSPKLDIDLNNITFCDIPWLFPEAYPGELNQESLRSLWQPLPNRYLRLLALGIDSFNIISHMGQLDTTPYPGATGSLSLNLENRITRQLVCAKFIAGQPVLQDYSYPMNNEFSAEEYSIDTEEFVQ